MTLLSALREHTRDSHRRVEAAMDVLAPGFGRAEYAWLLQVLRRFHTPLEAAIDAALAGSRYARYRAGRSRAAALDADLTALRDAEIRCGDAQSVARDANWPHPVHDRDSGVGALYVVEGSALGGLVIARHLRSSLGLTAECGLRFFTLYASDAALRWAALTRELERDIGNVDRIVSAAVATFEGLIDLLGAERPEWE